MEKRRKRNKIDSISDIIAWTRRGSIKSARNSMSTLVCPAFNSPRENGNEFLWLSSTQTVYPFSPVEPDGKTGEGRGGRERGKTILLVHGRRRVFGYNLIASCPILKRLSRNQKVKSERRDKWIDRSNDRQMKSFHLSERSYFCAKRAAPPLFHSFRHAFLSFLPSWYTEEKKISSFLERTKSSFFNSGGICRCNMFSIEIKGSNFL